MYVHCTYTDAATRSNGMEFTETEAYIFSELIQTMYYSAMTRRTVNDTELSRLAADFMKPIVHAE